MGGKWRELTVMIMHGLSLAAPQQPKHATTKMIDPMTMSTIGAVQKLSP